MLRLVKVLLFRFTFHIIKVHFEYREIKWEELKKKTKKKDQIQNENVKFSLLPGGRDGDDSGDRIRFSMNCNTEQGKNKDSNIFFCSVTTVRWSLLKRQDFDTVISIKVCTIFKIAMVFR